MEKDKIMKRHLAETVVRELKTKSIEEITVQDIISSCEISRSTFYRYFKDKFDLLNWIFSQYMDELTSYYSHDSLCYKQVIFDITSFMSNSQMLFLKCFSYTGQNSFQEHFLQRTTEYITEHLEDRMDVEALSKEYATIVAFNSAGVLHTIVNWLQGGCKETPREISRIIVESMPEKIKYFFTSSEPDFWNYVHTSSPFEFL